MDEFEFSGSDSGLELEERPQRGVAPVEPHGPPPAYAGPRRTCESCGKRLPGPGSVPAWCDDCVPTGGGAMEKSFGWRLAKALVRVGAVASLVLVPVFAFRVFGLTGGAIVTVGFLGFASKIYRAMP